ncbi:MAG: TIGR03032 family protein [Pirellulales bacterium]|nr:TIGR03032 family protein [Pirellulales bacterium]
MNQPADDPVPSEAEDAQPRPDELPPLRSVHTSSLPQIFSEGGFSLLVTTYQAGKLVILRNDHGVLNTHFRNFMKPMGLAVQGGKLAVGCNVDIWEFHNVPAVCPKLNELDEFKEHNFNHDACFLPRRSHTTGDIQIHEMAWVDKELWFVNTTFSCLATRSESNSFEPRWRPSFVTDLVPGDKCHLNGLALRDGRVRYVTALGETNTPGGWRDNKRDGGLLIDVESQEILTRGLSMPHSPRWYRDQLWILESGTGGIGTIDLATGKYQEVAQLPGFTRGLSFLGPLAFVGLSQVRESAVFSGIPLVERLEERTCGVWVVNIETGQTVAFCRFEDAVQEIFAVEILIGSRFPDLINHDAELIGRSYVLADEALAEVPEELRSSGETT